MPIGKPDSHPACTMCSSYYLDEFWFFFIVNRTW